MIETPPNELNLDSESRSETVSQVQLDQDQSESLSIFNCQAMMVCLEGRRFVIVRPEEHNDLIFASDAKSSLRDLDVGDQVVYRGKTSIVKAVDVYC